MNDTHPPDSLGTAQAGVAPPEPARMSPLSRYFNVFFSPGAVFEDIRRDPRGWWMPLLIVGVVSSLFALLYVGRFHEFLPDIVAQQVKDNAFLKLAPPEARDKAIEAATSTVKATPIWQMQLGQIAQVAFNIPLVVWFFTFLYSLVALLMGWLTDL